MAHALDAAELLGVDVQQIAGVLMLVAHDRLARLQIAQPRQAGACQHPTDGALGHPQARGDAGLGQAAAAQLDDRQRLGRGDRSWTALGRDDGRPARLTFGQVAPQPLAHRRQR